PSQCDPYCEDVAKCKSTAASNYSSLYETKARCLGICQHLDTGSSSEAQGTNTVACRDLQINSAEQRCDAAGPGGANQCGTDCDAYCTLYHRICGDKAFDADFQVLPNSDPEAVCRDACTRGFVSAMPYTVDVPNFNLVDTLQCRLWHLTTATIEDPELHCGHAQLHPNDQCGDNPATSDVGTYCARFCALNQKVCNTVAYDSPAECQAVCAALPAGTQVDEGTNTRGCRMWHTYSALTDPITHCPHTSAGGDGVCSTDNCEAYCQLLNSPAFAQKCPGTPVPSTDPCKVICGSLPGAAAGQFSVADGGAGSVECLLKHVSRVLADEMNGVDGGPSECQLALSGADCQ
ncbi:MAG TPA: hypothetical protein VGL13_17950, partial [Polyangiaceae bacterium]